MYVFEWEFSTLSTNGDNPSILSCIASDVKSARDKILNILKLIDSKQVKSTYLQQEIKKIKKEIEDINYNTYTNNEWKDTDGWKDDEWKDTNEWKDNLDADGWEKFDIHTTDTDTDTYIDIGVADNIAEIVEIDYKIDDVKIADTEEDIDTYIYNIYNKENIIKKSNLTIQLNNIEAELELLFEDIPLIKHLNYEYNKICDYTNNTILNDNGLKLSSYILTEEPNIIDFFDISIQNKYIN